MRVVVRDEGGRGRAEKAREVKVVVKEATGTRTTSARFIYTQARYESGADKANYHLFSRPWRTIA